MHALILSHSNGETVVFFCKWNEFNQKTGKEGNCTRPKFKSYRIRKETCNTRSSNKETFLTCIDSLQYFTVRKNDN